MPLVNALRRSLLIIAATIAWLQSYADTPGAYQGWVPDYLGDSTEMRYVRHPDDYSGHVRSTLIRRLVSPAPAGAVLYVHGFNDYFFQKEMADQFNLHGYNFYAVDLRKYGRSLMSGQRAFETRDMAEYFPDLDSALVEIRNAGNHRIVLMGHSTGGLLCAYYLARRANPVKVDALVLNSPFMDWNLGKVEWLVPAISALGYVFPDIKIPQGKSTAYAESLLDSHHGEWNYRTDWKVTGSNPVTAGWVRAIDRAQDYLHSQDHPIRIPILLMYSSRSHQAEAWDPECQSADVVLDVKDIRKYGLLLGTDVTCVKVQNGLHDLFLSRPGVRKPLYAYMFKWLSAHH